MDITRQNKPFHLKCPKCGEDISLNGKNVKRKYDRARERVCIAQERLAREKSKHGRSKYFNELVKELEHEKRKAVKAKNEWCAVNNHGEHQLFIIFKNKLYSKYGKENIIKILEECEDEMFYYDNEFMKQDHNNFSGA